MKIKEKIIFLCDRLLSKVGSFFDLLGAKIEALFFGQFGTKLTYKREKVIILLIIAAVLIFVSQEKWLIWLGIFLMMVNIFLWLIIIFSWTLDPLIDYKVRIHKIKRWGERLLRYLSGEFKDIEAKHHLEASAWGKLAYFHDLKNEVINFSKTNLLQKFLGRFFSTFIILIFGYAFIYFGLQKIIGFCFVSSAEQQGLARFGSIFDFVYYSTITISTVGYGDIYPIHPFARAFVMTEVLCGALIVIFLIASFTSISVHLTTERQQAIINEIEKEIKDIDSIFSELKELYKERQLEDA